jgi:hypothetical protein
MVTYVSASIGLTIGRNYAFFNTPTIGAERSTMTKTSKPDSKKAYQIRDRDYYGARRHRYFDAYSRGRFWILRDDVESLKTGWRQDMNLEDFYFEEGAGPISLEETNYEIVREVPRPAWLPDGF